MFTIRKNILNLPIRNTTDKIQTRCFWEYVNMMFNKPDSARVKSLGPDRTCAEWVLRNGGKVVWANGTRLSDYNSLPPDTQSVPKLKEIDGSGSSISHYGFPHLSGCTELWKIILDNNKYIDDRALKGLHYAQDTLTYVQVSQCINVTDKGVKELSSLGKLQTLVLYKLSNVNNLKDCKEYLQAKLTNCKIKDDEEKVEV